MSTTGYLVPRCGRHLRAVFFVIGVVAFFSGMSANPDDAPSNARMEIMVPVAQFEVSPDERWVVIYGFLAENGKVMKLGQKFLQPDDRPVGNDGFGGCWIDGAKLPAIRRLAPKSEAHFRFGPESIKWRGGQWVRVQPSPVFHRGCHILTDKSF